MAAAAAVLEEAMRRGAGSVGDDDVAARRAEEAAIRRNEAASWLRKTVGVVCARDLPEEPSEEEFQLGLRNGIVLCNALNKVQPDAIPKIVGVPSDTAVPADGSALCAYQYFENLRNFLVVIEDFGFPTFEVFDLEKGGKSVRIVDCILAMKSFSESKKTGRQAASPGAVSTDDRPETGVAISTYEVPVADVAVSTDEGPGAGVVASANEGPGAAGMCQMPKKLKLQVQGPLSQERN